MKKVSELTAELALPLVEQQGCTLWDVEYVREAGTWYLRVLLDKERGLLAATIPDHDAIREVQADIAWYTTKLEELTC